MALVFSVYVVVPAAMIAGMIRIGRTLMDSRRRESRRGQDRPGNESSRWRSRFAQPAPATAPRPRQDPTLTMAVAMVLWMAGAIAVLVLGSGGQGGVLLALYGAAILGLYGLVPSPNWRIALPIVGIAWASVYVTLGVYFVPGLLALLVGAIRAEAAAPGAGAGDAAAVSPMTHPAR